MIGPLAAALALLALPAQARAEEDPDAALCERAILNGARRRCSTPSPSPRRGARPAAGPPFPWAINREGQGRWFETREEALAFARQSVADGRRGNSGSASGRRPSPEGRSPATP
jgi:hypothetical protein